MGFIFSMEFLIYGVLANIVAHLLISHYESAKTSKEIVKDVPKS